MTKLLIDILLEEHGVKVISQVVRCYSCGMSMYNTSPKCYVHDDGCIYCTDCLPPSDEEVIEHRRNNTEQFLISVRNAYLQSVLQDYYDMDPGTWGTYLKQVAAFCEEQFPPLTKGPIF